MPMPGMDMMGGGPPGMGGGMPGGMPMPQPPSPADQLGLAALDGLSPKSPNPTAAMQQVEKALDMAHQLIMTSLTQVSQQNPKVSKDLHTIARQLLATKLEIKKESPLGIPPDLMMGMQGGGGPGNASGMPPAPPMMGS